jgi:hypothetical protein
MSIVYSTVWDGSVDVTLQNLSGRGFDVIYGLSSAGQPSDVRILGGDFGPCENVSQGGGCPTYLSGANIVVDGVRIHDMTSNDLATYHVDGMFIRGCSGCAVRNSTFSGNMVTNIRIQNCCGLSANSNLMIEGNRFYPPLDADGVTKRSDAIDIDTPTPGLVIRSNTFDPAAGPLFTRTGYSGERLVQNKMLYIGPCASGVSYESNTVKAFSATWGNVLCGSDQWGTWSF